MNNNEIFIDTMDKINTIAKSKGFVNGLDWSKSAKMIGEISDVDFSTFENCHNLRNLMAHGSAKDISLSNDTISQTIRFLSAIAQSRAVPTIKTAERDPLDPETYIQEGDIIFVPFFYGYTSTKTTPREINNFSEVYLTEFSQQITYDHMVAGMVSRVDKIKNPDGSYRLEAIRHPSPDECGLQYPNSIPLPIVIRPSTDIKIAIMSSNAPIYTTQYKYMDGMLHLTLAKRSYWNNRTLCDLLTGQEELKTYSCKAHFISDVFFRSGCNVKSGKASDSGLLKKAPTLFLSYPPQYGQPYYYDYIQWQRDNHFEYSRNKNELFGYKKSDLPF